MIEAISRHESYVFERPKNKTTTKLKNNTKIPVIRGRIIIFRIKHVIRIGMKENTLLIIHRGNILSDLR